MAPNSSYWKLRMERILIENEKTALEFEKDLRRSYAITADRVRLELESFFQRYAKENKITYAEARERLSNADHKRFRDRQAAYLAEVELLGNNPQYASYLRSLSGKAYITKVEEILANIRYHIETMSTKYLDGTSQMMKTAYEDGFYKTLYDVHLGVGFGMSFTALGSDQLEAAVKEKWNGDNYSGRIWQNRDKLVQSLNTIIPQEFVRGRSVQQIARDLSDRLDVSYRSAVRLVRTELNYISNKATIKSYAASGVMKQFEYLATLDARTSDICRELDGQVFNLKDAKTGINVPPLHPHCRSTTVPHFEDELFNDSPVDRIARNAAGNSYLVGKDVTFKQWAAQYADAAYAKRK